MRRPSYPNHGHPLWPHVVLTVEARMKSSITLDGLLSKELRLHTQPPRLHLADLAQSKARGTTSLSEL